MTYTQYQTTESMDNNSYVEENNDDQSANYETELSRLIKFYCFLPIQLVAVPVSLFVLYHLFTKPSLRRSLPNHVLIALNIVTLIDVLFQQSGSMIFFKLNRVWPESYGYCIFVNYLDFLNYALNLQLTVWALFERQVFIFNPHFCRAQIKRNLCHYLPLAVIMMGNILYYIGLIVLNPCINTFDYSQSWCGDLCFLETKSLYFIDWIMNGLIPMSLIIVLSAILFIRVIRHRHRVYRSFAWRKHRKLTLQLLSISTLYTMCFFPTILIAIISEINKDPEYGLFIQTPYLDYLPILARCFTPFLSLATLPEVSRKLKACGVHVHCCYHNAIVPRKSHTHIMMTTTRTNK